MGNSTTLAQLMAEPTSNKVVLGEIRVGEHLAGWTLTGGQSDTYDLAYLNETIQLANDVLQDFRKLLVAVEEDGTELTERSSIGAVESNPGSFYHDTSVGVVYVHPVGSDEPDSHTLVGFFWFRVATEAKVLDGQFYEPLLSKRGVPKLSRNNPNVHWGITEIGGGWVRLIGTDGFFDQISKRWLWHNKKVRILLGGEDLPYSEYLPMFTGLVKDKKYSRREFKLQVKSNAFRLLRQLPINSFFLTNFPNMDPNAEGSSIPYCYGDIGSNHAPVLTCIDQTSGTNVYEFKICDHAISSIYTAYVNHDEGAGWQSQALDSSSFASATIKFSNSDFVLGTSEAKVAFAGKSSGGALLSRGPNIVEDILLSYCGYTETDVSSTAFGISKERTEFDLNVLIEKTTSAKSIIEKICASDLAFFDEDGEGVLRYRTWQPEQTGDETKISDIDMLEGPPVVDDDADTLFWKMRIGYSYNAADKEYLFAEDESLPSLYKYEKDEERELETYVRTKTHADILAGRLLLISQDPSPLLMAKLKLPLIGKTFGDKIKVTMGRAPFAVAGGYDERVFEIFGLDFQVFPVIQTVRARDLRDYGAGIGFWAADATTNWDDSTEAQRQTHGFWCNATGFASASLFIDSQNISRWW